ncbi:MAG: MFS transporter [Chlamydiales bacterium]|nr:MFS transporter [Chlamydiales bacterium]
MRVTPSVMVDSLMAAFNTDAATIGAISAIYFYIYAPMQFPVGLLMDRFGPRKLLSMASVAGGIGGLLFGLAPNLEILSASRFLMGFGSSFAFVGLLFITSHWFPREKLALLIGIANSISMLGAVSGEGPVSLIEDWIGWRYAMIVIGLIGILLGLFIFFVVRQTPTGSVIKRKKIDFKNAWLSLKKVLSHPFSWLNAAIAMLLYLPTGSFAALWAVPFLMHNHGLSRTYAGFASSSIYIGWILGGPLIGHLSDHFEKRRLFIKICSLLAGISLIPIILFTHLPLALIITLLILVGIFSSTELLNFSYAIDLHSEEGTGSAIAFTNFFTMIGAAILQPLVGGLLDYFWSGEFNGTIKDYSYTDYKFAMILFPLSFFLAFFLSFFLRERGDHKKVLMIF